jgi:hypothetical protein
MNSRLQTIEVLGIVLRRFDVGGELGDCCFEVVHFLPDRRSHGRFVSGFRAIREQRRHLLGVFSKGRIDLLYFGQVEGPLALDHLRTDLRLRAALFHQGLALVDEPQAGRDSKGYFGWFASLGWSASFG